MARVSSVERLDPAIREEIARLRQRGRTIDEILAHLRGLDVDVSRSALGRHLKGREKLFERLRVSREIAAELVRQRAEAAENQTLQLNLEILHSIVFDLVSKGEDGEPLALSPKEVHDLAKALDHMARAFRSNAEAAARIRADAAKEAAAAVDRVARAKGLSAEAVTALKAEFLGIERAA